MKKHVRDSQDSENQKAAIITKAVRNAADLWGLNNNQLGRILGLSDSSISRLKRNQYFLNPNNKEWELALLFLRIFRGLDAYMGGHVENEKNWLLAENQTLTGIPLELMQTIEGLSNVVQYIDCVRGR